MSLGSSRYKAAPWLHCQPSTALTTFPHWNRAGDSRGMNQDEVKDEAHPWVLLRCLEGGEARQAGGQEEVAVTVLGQAVLSDRAVPSPQHVLLLGQGCPQPTACPAAWPALGPCCSASPVLCAAAARWERSSFLTG